jgi:hypothetical protein
MLIFAIRATTTDDDLQSIPYLDMRQESTERRDDALAIINEQGDQVVLEYHNIDGVDVLFSPAFGYAMVNEQSSGVGNSLVIETWQCESPEHAVRVWREGEQS